MRRWAILLMAAAVSAFAFNAFADDTAKKETNQDKTGFTDAANTPAGTNVVTGEETPPAGARSGLNPNEANPPKRGEKATRKAKKTTRSRTTNTESR